MQTQKFSPLVMFFHWFTFLALIGVYVAVEGHEWFERGTDMRKYFMIAHFWLGLSVLLLTVPRIITRFFSAYPPITPTPPVWQDKIAKLTLLAMYVWMLAMPLLGWAMQSAEGREVTFWGMQLPALLDLNKELGHDLEEVHEALGTFGYLLIGVHILAAIWHQHVMKDDTLQRMRPGR
ncbi:cytochrome b [Bowmanella sp. JS7-9]|uniref:Cytochrome b n=1 Tax=Pseudobowmanella zhangzhouensis TaxID=1537679 RepID=A0ABW1XFV3_9ALTE|nr:cytochrome b [Bowmanella sp. JS7-9]TBX21418.1 hypothetical protein TK45_12800 [Bowmanella sp. JS7-9]